MSSLLKIRAIGALIFIAGYLTVGVIHVNERNNENGSDPQTLSNLTSEDVNNVGEVTGTLKNIQDTVYEKFGVTLSASQLGQLNCNLNNTRFSVHKCLTDELKQNGKIVSETAFGQERVTYGGVQHEGHFYRLIGNATDNSYEVILEN